jgi:hypothetical protein
MDPASLPYRLGAGLNGAVFGAIGGALAGGSGFLIERLIAKSIPQSWKIGAISAGFVLGVSACKLTEISIETSIAPLREAIYQQSVRPKIDRALVQRALRDAGDAGKLYRLLEKKEPAVFDAIVGVVVANLRNGAPTEQVIGLIREQFIERISKPRMGYLPDDDLLQMFDLSAAMARSLARTNPLLCLAMLHGRPFGDLSPFVGAELARREETLMERLLQTPPDPLNFFRRHSSRQSTKEYWLDYTRFMATQSCSLIPPDRLRDRSKQHVSCTSNTWAAFSDCRVPKPSLCCAL